MRARSEQKAEDVALKVLRKTLIQIPLLRQRKTERNVPLNTSAGEKIDIMTRLKMPDWSEEQLLIVEIKNDGNPRNTKYALSHLLICKEKFPDAYGVVMAPQFSARAKDVCKQEGIGYIDFSGNCFLCFKNIHIEKEDSPNLFKAEKNLVSLFSPKTSRILRLLLENPGKIWHIGDLTKQAGLSSARGFTIKKKLLEHKFIQEEKGGKLFLAEPELLLNKWIENYFCENNFIHFFYYKNAIRKIEEQVAQYCNQAGIKYALTGFSGVERLSPNLGYHQGMIYVDSDKISEIAYDLDFEPDARGSNISLWKPYDEGVFYNSQEIQGITIASPLQIYLDIKKYRWKKNQSAEDILENIIRSKWR